MATQRESSQAVDGTLLVLSPHCDDAVFGCSGLIIAARGATVATVFAGRAPGAPLGDWDRDCGFSNGDDVIAARRAEDGCALRVLGAVPLWLDFLDAQFRRSPSPAMLAAALAELVRERVARDVAVPLGLFHSDHVLLADAALQAAGGLPSVRWWLYEDALVRRIDGATNVRVATLAAHWQLDEATLVLDPTALALKARAVACYATQLRGLAARNPDGRRDLLAPERHWRLRPRAPA